VTTPCGQYTVSNCKQGSGSIVTSGNATATIGGGSSSNPAINASSKKVGENTITSILVNRKLFKEVTCRTPASTPVVFKPIKHEPFNLIQGLILEIFSKEFHRVYTSCTLELL
jgi:hypothetical protein